MSTKDNEKTGKASERKGTVSRDQCFGSKENKIGEAEELRKQQLPAHCSHHFMFLGIRLCIHWQAQSLTSF